MSDKNNNHLKLIKTSAEQKELGKRLEKELEHVKARLNQSQFIANYASWEWNTVTNEIYWSENLYNIFKYNPAEVKPSLKALFSRVHSDDLKKVTQTIHTRAEDNNPVEVEFRIIIPDGSTRIIYCYSTLQYDPDTEDHTFLIGTIQDVTERKRVENQLLEIQNELESRVRKRSEKLTESNKKLLNEINERKEIEQELKYYEQIVSSSREFLTVVDKSYTYLSCNQYYLDTFQIKKQDIVNRAVADLHGEERFEKHLKPNLDRAFSGETVHINHWIEIPTGKRFVDGIYAPLYNEAGDIYAVVVSVRDITDKHEYLNALTYSNELKGTILNTALNGIITIDENSEIQEFNLSAERIFACKLDDVKQKNICDLIVPANLREKTNHSLLKYLNTVSTKALGVPIRIMATRANGDEFPAELTLAEINLSNKHLYTAFIKDISNRTRFEKTQESRTKILEVLLSKKPLATILKIITDSTVNILPGASASIELLDESGKVLQLSAATGLSEDYINALGNVEVAPNVGSCGVAAYYKKTVIVTDIETDPNWQKFRHVATKDDLKACWSVPIFSSTETILGTFAIYYKDNKKPDEADIQLIKTQSRLVALAIERKEAEQILLESEERFRSSFVNGPLGMGIGDKQGNILQVNKALCDFSGYTEAELVSKNFRDFIHEDDLALSVENIKQLFTGEIEHYKQIRRYKHKKGHYLWVDVNVSIINDSNGKPNYLVNHLQDVTERIHSEKSQEAQHIVLEHIISGATQQDILNNLCQLFEPLAPLGAKAFVSLYSAEEETISLAAGPSLPEELTEILRVYDVNQVNNTCVCAINSKKMVIAEDVSRSSAWEGCHEIADQFEIKASWSMPYFSHNNNVMGTFGFVFPRPTAPLKYDVELLTMGGYLASIVIERTRSVKALRYSEEKYSKAYRASPISMTLTRLRDGYFLEVNDAFEQLTGYTTEQAVGHTSLELNIYAKPNERQELIERLKKEGLVRNFEMVIQTVQGELKHILFSAEMIRIGDDDFMLGNQIDITKQRQADSLQHAQRVILEQIVSGNTQQEILDNLGLLFETLAPSGAHAFITSFDSENQTISLIAGPSIPDKLAEKFQNFEIGPNKNTCAEAISTKKMVIAEDVKTSPAWEGCREFGLENGILASWSLPYVSDKGEVLGTFGFQFDALAKPSAYDLELLTMGGYLASIVIERMRSMTELSESEARFRGAFGNAPLGTALIDKNGAILQSNARTTEVIGYSHEEIIGKHITEVSHPDDLDASAEKFKALMAGDIDSYQLEKRYRHKDGHYVWCRLSLSLVHDHSGKPIYAISHIEDISERKKSEDALLRYNRALEMLNQCNSTLFHTVNGNELLAQVCNIIVNVGGYRLAWVGYAQEDEVKTILPRAKAGFEEGYLDETISWERMNDNFCPITEAILTENPVAIKNIDTEEKSIRWREAALSRDYHSCIALPLIADDKAFGALVVYAKESDIFDDDELTLLIHLSENLSFGIQSIRNRKVRAAAEQSLRISEQKFRALFDENPCMFFTVNTDATVLSVNNFGATELGYQPSEIIGRSLFSFTNDENMFIVNRYIKQCIDEPEKVHRWEMETKRKNGSTLWIRITARIASDIDNENTILVVCEDITEARELSDKLVHEATHDGLTGLINRHEFEVRLQRALHSAKNDYSEHILCYMDLDRFKVINDTCGHLAGDNLLQQLSEMLRGNIRNRDSLARLGGDEFGLLIEHCSLTVAEQIAWKIKQTVTDFNFYWEGNIYKVGVSIGLVEINEDSIDIDNVLMTADNACYTAKDKGRDRIHIHKEGDTELESRRKEMLWTTRIEKAFQEDRFHLVYQSIMSLDANEDKGEHGEILIRMEDEDKGIVTPDIFIPVAERYNLITSIDEYVVDKTMKWLNTNTDFLERLYLCSINLSGASLVDNNFLNYVIEKITEYNISASKICFEITETAAIANLNSANHFISKLKEQGCLFALDDFGSGLSSFAYLKALPVDFLKIDGAFVKDIENEQGDLAIVKSIHEIGRALNKKTIAEFVENESIMQILKGIGVNYAQGYGIQRPQPINEINIKPDSNTGS